MHSPQISICNSNLNTVMEGGEGFGLRFVEIFFYPLLLATSFYQGFFKNHLWGSVVVSMFLSGFGSLWFRDPGLLDGRALLPAIMVVVVRTPKHAATPWLDKFDIIARSARPTAKAPTAP